MKRIPTSSMRTKLDKARVIYTALIGGPHAGRWAPAHLIAVRRKARLPMGVLDEQYERAVRALASVGVNVPATLP